MRGRVLEKMHFLLIQTGGRTGNVWGLFCLVWFRSTWRSGISVSSRTHLSTGLGSVVFCRNPVFFILVLLQDTIYCPAGSSFSDL